MSQNKKTEKGTPDKKGVEAAKEGGAYCKNCNWTGPISKAPKHASDNGHVVDWN